MNILIVDDDQTNRQLLHAILQKNSLNTFEAVDGLDALAVLEREPIDAVISDILMPRMDGYRLCREVRARARFRHLPFLVYSNIFSTPHDERAAFEAGVDLFLNRNLPAQEIPAVLRELMRDASERRHEPAPAPPDPARAYDEQLVARLEAMNSELLRQTRELRAAREQLRQSHSLLAAVIEGTTDTVFARDLDGRHLLINSAGANALGKTVEEIIGKTLPELFPPDLVRRFQETDQKVVATGETQTYEHTISLGGATVTQLVIKGPLREPQGGIIGILGSARNITQRKQAEDKLRSSEERLAFLLQATPVVIYTARAPGDVGTTFISENVRSQTGYDPREFVADAGFFASHLHPDDAPRVRAEFERLLERGELLTEYRFRFKDGSFHWMQDAARAIRNAQGTPVEIVGYWLDITGRKQAEAEMQNLSLRLLRAQDEERRRIARELHDSTAQKLAALTMNLGLLAEKFTDEKSAEKKIIGDSIALVDTCSQEVRTLSYLLHPPLLDELGLAVALRSYIEGFSRRSGIPVELDLPRDLKGLPTQIDLALFRVVQESLGNVHRHSGSATAAIRLAREPDRVVLEVRDRGAGLPPDKLALARSRAERLGVGIAGMQERVRQLGGQLELISGQDGTTVRAIVPLDGEARLSGRARLPTSPGMV